MKMKHAKALGLCSLMFSSLACADGILAPTRSMDWQPVIGVGGGGSFVDNLGARNYFPVTVPGQSQFFDYERTNENQKQGMFEVFLGAERVVFSDWVIQPGIAYSQAGTYQANGVLTQGLDIQSSDVFAYRYSVTTRQLLAQGKLMKSMGNAFYPYFLLGLGASFNTASNFETNIPPFLITTRDFANNNTSSFSYRVGVGVDANVCPHTRLGLAYRYSGLGAVNLGDSYISGYAMNGTLSQSSVNANEVLFQLTYII